MNKRMVLLAIFSLFAVPLCSTSHSQIITIGFESLRRDDTEVHLWGTTYDEGGFRFTAFNPIPGNANRFDTLGTLWPGFAGSTALYHGAGGGETTLTRIDGQAFNLYSIRLAEEPNLDTTGTKPINLGPFGLTFYGIKSDNVGVTETVTIDSFVTLKPYSLTGFDHVNSVSWFQGGGGVSGPTHQFDDVKVSTVPEAASVILLLGGAIPLLMLRRRKQRR